MAEAMLKEKTYAQTVINQQREQEDIDEQRQRKAHVRDNYEKRKANTFIFYNLMTAKNVIETIIKDLETYFDLMAKDFLLKIYRDTRFRTRYCVTFTEEKFFNKLFNEGAVVNGVRIKGQNERRY